ncbi:hypothetical protein NK6_6016 [Bradyrhizobium diazoefficiens]|uniref:Uncharacterized protein n=1 Tax=Bradyrhizobium diazoefficiens TaxID=1355477 RepID=A0A0E4BRT3_9BRAD|nr:hypothetical protein NK6_6016 [Bradyrhizobium diazoefficiens]
MVVRLFAKAAFLEQMLNKLRGFCTDNARECTDVRALFYP